MKKTIFSLLLLAPLLILKAQVKPEVMIMVEEKDFFRLKELVANPSMDEASKLYAEAVVYNAFGQNQQSIDRINTFLEKFRPGFSDSIYTGLMEFQIDNYYKINQFRKAAETTDLLLKNSSSTLDAEETRDLRNTGDIWASLANSPAPSLTHEGTTVIDFTRDLARLINVPVSRGETVTDAVFDTGANISVMARKTAEKYKLRIVEDSIMVKSITGKEVMAQIGIADEIRIRDITIKNPYFLIFDDSDLTFAVVYKINIIIGFPIIRQMGEIQFDLVKNQLTIPGKAEARNYANLCLDGLTPIVEMKLGDRPILLSFDSGADKTMFYPKFLDLVKNNPRYKLKEGTTMLGGAGGTKKIDIFTIDQVDLDVAGNIVSLTNPDVLPLSTSDSKEHLYGNMGQDVLSSKGKFIINLEKMYFELHN
jgi:hypothetical protein